MVQNKTKIPVCLFFSLFSYPAGPFWKKEMIDPEWCLWLSVLSKPVTGALGIVTVSSEQSLWWHKGLLQALNDPHRINFQHTLLIWNFYFQYIKGTRFFTDETFRLGYIGEEPIGEYLGSFTISFLEQSLNLSIPFTSTPWASGFMNLEFIVHLVVTYLEIFSHCQTSLMFSYMTP